MGTVQPGLNRLITEGAFFDRGAYPIPLSTFTCPGLATIGTGAFPTYPRHHRQRVVEPRPRIDECPLYRRCDRGESFLRW